jgi:RNA polymerase sigma-70 factor (ECF subfamily)
MSPMSEALASSAVDRGSLREDRAGPAARLEAQETSARLLDLLATLPANQQEVVRLKFQSGLSYKEIAAVTELSVSNVGYLIHVALQALRKGLGN